MCAVSAVCNRATLGLLPSPVFLLLAGRDFREQAYSTKFRAELPFERPVRAEQRNFMRLSRLSAFCGAPRGRMSPVKEGATQTITDQHKWISATLYRCRSNEPFHGSVTTAASPRTARTLLPASPLSLCSPPAGSPSGDARGCCLLSQALRRVSGVEGAALSFGSSFQVPSTYRRRVSSLEK